MKVPLDKLVIRLETSNLTYNYCKLNIFFVWIFFKDLVWDLFGLDCADTLNLMNGIDESTKSEYYKIVFKNKK